MATMIQRKSGKAVFPFAKSPLLFGHRGCSKAYPENTLSAFRGVLDNGVPGVELDIHMCRSGELVVIHDFNTLRTTGIDAVVEELDYTDIKKLDAGSIFSPAFKGEQIPSLEEVFDLMGSRVYYDLEIKHRQNKYGPVEKKLLETISRYGLEERVLVSSFNPIAVKGIKKYAPGIPTAVIYAVHPKVPFLLRRGAGKYIANPDILKPDKAQVSRKMIKTQKYKKKYGIIAWVEDDKKDAEKLLEMGVDGLVSNQPEVLKSVVEKYYS